MRPIRPASSSSLTAVILIKHQLTIAQIKEVMRITFEELAKMTEAERKSILDRYKDE